MSLRHLIIAIGLCLAGPGALAEPLDFPAVYRVVGVASDDVLNVRAAPKPGAAILAELDHDEARVEVLGTGPAERWARVSTREGTGYAAMRFLERRAGQDPTVLPKPLFCGGTEPFWGLNLGPRGNAALTDPDTPRRVYRLVWSGAGAARPGEELGATFAGTKGRITAVLQREFCTDGMSDREFGLKVDAVVSDDGETFMLTGCCSLTR